MTKQLKSVFIVFIVAIAVVAFFWVAKNLGGGEGVESEKPAVICKPQNAPPASTRRQGEAGPEQPSSAEATADRQECFWTAHIHATARVFRDGTEIPVSFEKGELEGQHTHSEPNKIHWHGLIPVDSKTKELTDWSALEVQRIVADFGLPQEITPRFIVNSQEVEPSYIWQDGDIIEIRY